MFQVIDGKRMYDETRPHVDPVPFYLATLEIAADLQLSQQQGEKVFAILARHFTLFPE